MKNILRDTTELAKLFCEKYIDDGGVSIAVDATCGNGHDTLWLAQRCARVYAFDVQKAAVSATAALLAEHGVENVSVICDSHALMSKYVAEQVNIIMFNLGYLPGGDKTVATGSDSTIEALTQSLELLAVNGLVCVIMYWGHPQGAAERRTVLDWAAGLDKGRYHCIHTDMINQPNCPPEILLITKKR